MSKIDKKNTLIKEIVSDTKDQLEKFSSSNNSKYKDLLKMLIIQGMTQMLEPECILRVRKEDEGITKQLISTCEKEFSNLMKEKTGREYKCELNLDTQHHIESKLGGVHLFDKTMTILCCNDLESRLELSYNKLLPDIKGKAFSK